jgi:copper chaperone NosL
MILKHPFLKTFVLVIITLLMVAGCGNKKPEPFTPDAKTDKCALCKMAVKDDHFATELILENGKAMAFDDLGCMDKWIKQNKDKKQAVAYVRDFNTNKWVELEKATFVHDNEAAKTPMAYNVISFADKKNAQQFIAENKGELLANNDLQNYTWDRDPAALKKLMDMKAKREAEKAAKIGAENASKMEDTGSSMK